MAELWQLQTNFTRGELDPKAVGRTDLGAYYAGGALLQNVLTDPLGGAKKRPGMQYLATALGDGRIENFSFNVEQNYLLVFTDLRMQIFKDGVLQTNINGSGNDYAVTPWTLAQLADVDYIQSADTAIITHPDVAPYSITRTSDTDWTVAALTLSNIPQYDYNDASSPTPTAEEQDLTFSNHTEGDRYKLSLESILTEEIVFAGDDATNEENIRVALQELVNTGKTGITVTTQTSGSEYRVSLDGDSAKDWDLITGTAISTVNANFAVATVRNQTGVARTEDVWSATRGWPRTCTFHESRLYFGGSLSLPNWLWGSRVGDFFNFETGRGLDDEAIIAALDTDQVNAIEGIFSNRSLQIFTSGGEFYVPASPVTPSNIAVTPQSNLGSKRVRPVTVDGVTLFVQRTGKSINQFVFLNDLQSNQTLSISVLAQHLIKNPVKLSVNRGTSSVDANYVYILNSDGTVTVFNTLVAENVTAFTRWETDGEVKSVAVVDNEIYHLVERRIGGDRDYFVERQNDSTNTDANVIQSGIGGPTLTGLNHLEGETVDVKADGAYKGQFVVSGGQITINRDADTIEAGLAYSPRITLMPLNTPLQNGPNAFSKKKIARVAVNIFESNGVIVNGQRLADRTIGQDQFDAPIPQTGIKRIHVLGWSLDATVDITQDTPMPFHILSVGMEVKT